MTRRIFGFSFSTWRFHLRGAEIRSARDVGWVSALTAGKMMRRGPETMLASMTVAQARQKLPLGATTRIVLVDAQAHYVGIVVLADLYADGVKLQAPVQDYAQSRANALAADADALAVMRQFDSSQSDELAVLDEQRHVLGVLSERFVRKRYAEELERQQRELLGERVDDPT